jgi:putative inorganic carbon (HCO3(-)) transporter
MTALRRPLQIRALQTGVPITVLWAVLAVAAGLLVVRLPLLTSAALAAGVLVLAAAFWEPALGLGLALALGTARAYLAAARPGWPSDLGQIFLAVALAGWLARAVVRRKLVISGGRVLLPLALYLGAGWLSLLAASSLEEAVKEVIKWAEIAAIVVLVMAEARRGRAGWIVAAVVLAGAVQAAIGIWQYQFRGTGPIHFLILGNHYRAYGTFEQPNPYAGFLGLVWPVAAGLNWASLAGAWPYRRQPGVWLKAGLYGLAAALMLVGVYVSFSRGAWLGAGAAALALVIAQPRRWWVGVSLVVTTIGLGWALTRAGLLPASITARLADVADFTTVTDVRGVNITGENFAIVERLAHWQAADAMARAHPWLGVGIGNYGTAYPKFSLLNWPLALGHAHMIYLNVLAENGLVGLAAYLILWGSVFALTIQAIRRSTGLNRGLALGLLGAWTHLSVHQLVDNLYVNNIPLTVGALLGLLAILAQPAEPVRAQGAQLEIESR